MTPAPTGDPAAITLFFCFRAWEEFKQMSGQYGAAGSDELLKDWLERSLHTEARFIKTSDVVTLFTGGISLECQSGPAIDENGRGVVLSVASVFRPLPSMLELAAVFALPDGVVWRVSLEGSEPGFRFQPLTEPAASSELAGPGPGVYSEFMGVPFSGAPAAIVSAPSPFAMPAVPSPTPETRRPASVPNPVPISDSVFIEKTRWLQTVAPGLSFGQFAYHELAKALSDWSTGLGQSGSYLVVVLGAESLHGIRAMLGQVDPPAFVGEGRELWEALREAQGLKLHLSWPSDLGARLMAESEKAAASITRLNTIERLRGQSRELSAALQKVIEQKAQFRLPATPAMTAKQWRLSRRLSRLVGLESVLKSDWWGQSVGERRVRPKSDAKYAKALEALILAAEDYLSRYGAIMYEADSKRLSSALERVNAELLRQDPGGDYRDITLDLFTSKKAQLQSVLDRANSRLQAWQAWQRIGTVAGESALLRCFRIPHLFLVDRGIDGVWDLLSAARPGIIVAESVDSASACASAEIAVLLHGNALKPVAGTTTETNEAIGELRRALASWRPSDDEISATFPGLSAVHGRALLLNLTGRG